MLLSNSNWFAGFFSISCPLPSVVASSSFVGGALPFGWGAGFKNIMTPAPQLQRQAVQVCSFISLFVSNIGFGSCMLVKEKFVLFSYIIYYSEYQ